MQGFWRKNNDIIINNLFVSNNKRQVNVFIRYTLLFLLFSLFVYLQFINRGITLISYKDGYRQFTLSFADIGQFVRQALSSGRIPLWSWEIGLGSDIMTPYSSMPIGDPFAYILAFFPSDMADVANTIAIFLRVYFIGFVFLLFLKERKTSDFISLIATLSYVFSAFMLTCGTSMVYSLGPLIFPLLLLGIEIILVKKTITVFAISFAWALIASPYMVFMCAPFVLLYFFFRYKDLYSNFLKTGFTKILFKAFLAGVIGIMIASPVLFPTIYGNMNSARIVDINNETILSLFSLYDLKNYIKIIPALSASFSSPVGISVIGLPVLSLLMLPVFLKNAKKQKGILYPLILGVLTILLPGISMILNGFRYPTGRWVFSFVALVCLMVAETLQIKEAYSLKDIFHMKIVLFVLMLWSVVVCEILYDLLNVVTILQILITLFMGAMFIHEFSSPREILEWNIRKKRTIRIHKKTKIVLLLFIYVVLFSNVLYSPKISSNSYIAKGIRYGEIAAKLSDHQFSVAQDIEDDSLFYRISTVDQGKFYSLESVYYDVSSLYTYLSVIDDDWSNFNETLLNKYGQYRMIVQISSDDNRTGLAALLGTKYYIGERHYAFSEYTSSEKRNASVYVPYGFSKADYIDSADVYENKYDTGIGFVYETAIKESKFLSYNYLQREQIMLQAAVIPDDYSLADLNIDENGELITDNIVELEYTIRDEDEFTIENNTIYNNENDDRIDIELDFNAVENCEIYLYIKNLKRKSKAEGDDEYEMWATSNGWQKKIYYSSDDIQRGITPDEFLMNLGYAKSSDDNIIITLANSGDYTYDEITVYAVSLKNYDSQAAKLEDNRLELEIFDNNYIKGTVSPENDGVLYLSILHNDGWKAYIDGVEKPTFKTNIGFTGVAVSAGEHTVELVYRPVGMKIGVFLFGIGVLVLVVNVIMRKHKRKHHIDKDLEQKNRLGSV